MIKLGAKHCINMQAHKVAGCDHGNVASVTSMRVCKMMSRVLDKESEAEGGGAAGKHCVRIYW